MKSESEILPLNWRIALRPAADRVVSINMRGQSSLHVCHLVSDDETGSEAFIGDGGTGTTRVAQSCDGCVACSALRKKSNGQAHCRLGHGNQYDHYFRHGKWNTERKHIQIFIFKRDNSANEFQQRSLKVVHLKKINSNKRFNKMMY